MTQLNLRPAPRVYVAGPIHGSGHMTSNLYNALTAGNMLREAGCIPFIPHLFLLWELLRNDPDDQEFWLEMDETWLAQCHALVRIDGVSPGADREVAFAKARGIPVFDSSGVTGAAVPDVFVGVRRFIGEYKSGRFVRHLHETELHEVGANRALREMRDRIDRIMGSDHTFVSDTDRLNFLERVVQLKHGYGLDLLQQAVSDWLDQQPFGPNQTPDEPYMGIVEEVGELSRARLKARQGIRGSAEYHVEKEMDALGDIIIYMCGYAIARGFRLQACVERAWSEVSKRNWGANRETGVSRAAPTVAPDSNDLVREEDERLDAMQDEVQKAENSET